MALAALILFMLPGGASADAERCSEEFPGLEWTAYATDAPMTMATAGLNEATSERFAADVARVSKKVDADIGGLTDSVVCLATPELAEEFSSFVAPGQRLHAGVFGEKRLLVIVAVETRMIDDAIAFGIPHVALWQVGTELGLEGGYPEPLGSTIAHWYLARDTDRLDRFRNELVVTLFLDDPNPEERTAADALPWVGETKLDPYYFDPQFIGSQMGVFIDFAVAEEGAAVLRDPRQETWAELENRWRVSIRDEFPRGDFGVWWGVGIVVSFISLAILLALLKRYEKRRAARRRPTPPADESLFATKTGE